MLIAYRGYSVILFAPVCALGAVLLAAGCVSASHAERVHRYERSYGTFERTFALPNTVDPDRIEADFDGGVLSVTLPKAEKMRPREIRVKTGVASGQGRVSAKSADANGERNEK